MCIDSYNEPTVLSDNEQAAIAIVKAAFEQANLRFDIIDMCHRSTDYLTLLTPDGVDFCRIKAGARSTWISLDMWTYKGSAKDDTRFDSYANKKNRHWQINLRCIDDIASVADLIVAVFADICGNMEDISTNYTPLTNPSQLTTLTVKANKFADVHDYVVFDLETTGLERDCAIIEIGAVKIRNDIIVDRFCTNKVICLTGEFAHGAKSDIASKLVAMGAQMSDNVTKKVNILVVGSVGSQAWTYGNYGGKVKKAMELRDKGSDITIIGEEDLLNNIAVTV